MTRKTTLMTGMVVLALLAGIAAYYFYSRDEIAAGPRSHVSAEHLAPFQGRWEHMSRKAGGPPIPTGQYFFFRDDIVAYTTLPPRTGTPVYYYVIDALDPTHDPPWIDLTLMDRAPRAGQTVVYRQRGVYRFEGDTLVIRLSRPGDPRPLKAVTEPSQGEDVFFLKRAMENEP